MSNLDVTPTPAPAEVASAVTVSDFAAARSLLPWQRQALEIHARAAHIADTAPLAVLDGLLFNALHGRI